MSIFDTPDLAAKDIMNKVIESNPMKFVVGQYVKMVGVQRIPTAKSLAKFKLKVVDFREPVDGDIFLGRDGEIVLNKRLINPHFMSGCRFIVTFTNQRQP